MDLPRPAEELSADSMAGRSFKCHDAQRPSKVRRYGKKTLTLISDGFFRRFQRISPDRETQIMYSISSIYPYEGKFSRFGEFLHAYN